MQEEITSVAKALENAGYTTVRVAPIDRGRHTIVNLHLAPSALLDDTNNFAAVAVLEEAGLLFDSVTDFGDLLVIRDVCTPKMVDDRARAAQATKAPVPAPEPPAPQKTVPAEPKKEKPRASKS